MTTSFTVKHIQESGHEDIYPAAKVSYQPTIGNWFSSCFIDDGTGSSLQKIYGGTVFVMNEQGKTVSRYDLCAIVGENHESNSQPPKAHGEGM